MPTSRHPEHQLEFTLESHYSELERAVESVMEFMDACTEDEDLAHRVVLALSEAISNGMEHGNREERSLKVHVSVFAYQNEIVASVRDEGEGFDPSSIEDPMKEENLLKDSGRGLHIMKEICEKVWFEDDGRIINLKFIGDIRCDD